MKIAVAAFYADVPGKESRAQEYLDYAIAGKRALELTNPGARFVVLTDKQTAHVFEPHVETDVIATDGLPLVLQIIAAQRDFVRNCDADLIVLPDLDCLANKRLDDAIPADVGMAITHKGPKFHYRIINLAMVRDRDLAAWFLARAYHILEGWPREAQDWWGDQEAWGFALGIPVHGMGSYIVVERVADEILLARPEGRLIHIYPASTHNCPMSENGVTRPLQRNAFMVHLKGDRKQHLDTWMTERFGG